MLRSSSQYPLRGNNRTIINGVTQTWDNNGNLLGDGASTYTYDAANRLKTVTQGANSYSYVYNGTGDRLQQTVNGATTTYTLDLTAGLTQVLGDGTNTYLYGSERIAQNSTAAGKQYFLNDALGSVRRLTNAGGAPTLTRGYEPYGKVSSSSGAGSTAYGFAGEQVDGTGLSYNRARYYSAYLNQFIQPDPIVPNWRDPRTLNRYAYSYNNPINLTDPSGYDPYWCEGRNDETECYLTYQGYGRGAWKAAGGWEQSYYPNSLSFVLAYRKHIIAAAQRHSFIPASIAQASREQLDVLYTLAAILYQEHHGQEVRREEWSGIPVEDIAAYLGIRNPNTGLLPTIGLCQIRPDTTAVEIETLGLLYQPGTFDEPLTTPVPFEERKDAYPPYAQNVAMVERVERLLDPLWAIEYAAANMELATKQAQYSQPWMSHSRPDDVLQPWEKMTGWYARGHFNVNLGEYGKGEQDIKFYLDYTYADRVAIERLDVLGIKSLFR